MTTIALCLPTKDEIKTQTALDVSTLITYTMASLPGTSVRLMNERGAMIDKQRNNLADYSVRDGADYVFWVDSDMGFPVDALQRLLVHNKDIVGATYRRRVPPYAALGHFVGPPRDITKGGLVEADYMPGGLMLVKAEVYRKLGYPYYFTRTKWRGASPLEQFLNMADDLATVPMPKDLRLQLVELGSLRDWLNASHDGELNKSMQVMSEDYSFCQRVARAGYKIWCDLDLTYQVTHIGEQKVAWSA